MPRVFPRELAQEARQIPQTLPRSQGHYLDWAQAIKSGTQPSASFEATASLNEIVRESFPFVWVAKRSHLASLTPIAWMRE
jgi:hypothetical protein